LLQTEWNACADCRAARRRQPSGEIALGLFMIVSKIFYVVRRGAYAYAGSGIAIRPGAIDFRED
jgi:hypothetical protein